MHVALLQKYCIDINYSATFNPNQNKCLLVLYLKRRPFLEGGGGRGQSIFNIDDIIVYFLPNSFHKNIHKKFSRSKDFYCFFDIQVLPRPYFLDGKVVIIVKWGVP